MRSVLIPETNAYLGYHDLPGQMPACVYLAGLGGGASPDYPVARPGHGHFMAIVDDPGLFAEILGRIFDGGGC